MTPDEWSDAIYEATGMVVTREHAKAIGQLVAARVKEVEAERDRLREALRDCVETWRSLLADADLTAHENPAYLTLMRADLALGEDRA